MQGRRTQLARRPPPEASGSSSRAALGVLLAAAWLASTSALETEPTPPKETANTTDFSKQCECYNESLSLNCSFLSLKTVPEELDSCSERVSKVDASHNELESLDGVNVWFENELNVSHNRISVIHSDSFQSAVEVVDVSWNNVSTLDVEDMLYLKVLNASHNVLKQVTELPGYCDLEVLDLSSNLLVQIPEGIKQCRKLVVLNVSNNTLREFPDGLFQEFLDEGATDARTLLVDLRGNQLAPNDESLRALIDNAKPIFNAARCSCANLTRGDAALILCLSDMCTNDTEYWTSANGSNLVKPTPTSFPNTSVVLRRNESACEGDCEGTTVSSVFNSADEASVSIGMTSEVLSSTDVTTVPPTTTTGAQPSELPQKPRDPENGSRMGRADFIPNFPPPFPSPPPRVTTSPPPPTREGRKKRRVWVTLALTAVVLVAAGIGVYVLVRLYRRRRRQVLEERNQRIPLQPLIATPLSLRARDDDFVP